MRKIKKKAVARLLVVLALLEVSFAIHELGHFQAMKANGIAVEEFSLGIGPTVFGISNHPTFRLRLIPIMAYVKPSTEGQTTFQNMPALTRASISIAGVRSNLISALVALYLFLFLSWLNRTISYRELATLIVFSPIKVALRFLSFLTACLSFGKISIVEPFLLSTGMAKMPRAVEIFIRFGIALGLVNLMPILPLDGGRVISDLLEILLGRPVILNKTLGIFLFAIVFASMNEQDFRIFTTDRVRKTSDSKTS